MNWSNVKSSRAPGAAWNKKRNDRHKNSINNTADKHIQLTANNNSNGEAEDAILPNELPKLFQHEISPLKLVRANGCLRDNHFCGNSQQQIQRTEFAFYSAQSYTYTRIPLGVSRRETRD